MKREEREEAIEVFEGMVKTAEIRETFTIPRSVMIRAQKTALEALQAEPCGDAISRETAIIAMKVLEEKDIEAYGCKIPEGFDATDAIEALKALPSVTPKPKTGKWIHQGDKDEWWCDVGKCSVCDIEHIFGLPYCPNCGAKMEGMK